MSNTQTQEYVCGFLFNPTWERVLLIRKNRPEWQKGKLNGIGGKIEPKESPLKAMIREFKEEAGLHVTQWRYLQSLSDTGWMVHFWYARSAFFDDAISMTDEVIEQYNISQLPHDAIENLRLLIPKAISLAKQEEKTKGKRNKMSNIIG